MSNCNDEENPCIQQSPCCQSNSNLVVNVSEPSQKMSDRKEKTVLRIKFLVPGGHSFNSFRKMLQAKARTLDGVQRLTIKQILDISGKVVKILVDDASPVEFDQPLFVIEPN